MKAISGQRPDLAPVLSLLDAAKLLKINDRDKHNRRTKALRAIREIERHTGIAIITTTPRADGTTRFFVDRKALRKAAPSYFKPELDEAMIAKIATNLREKIDALGAELQAERAARAKAEALLRERDEKVARTLRSQIDALTTRVTIAESKLLGG